MEFINFSIIRHPINWVIVVLMVLIAGIAVNLAVKYQAIPSVRS